MSDFIIYHNPRCSKSRQTLELLKNNNITPLIRLYLEDPPNKRELKGILEKLNISPRELMRKNEEDYKKNNLSGKLEEILSIPNLIEVQKKSYTQFLSSKKVSVSYFFIN